MAEIELREVPLFSEMDEQEVAGIRAIMEEMKFKAGQVIIREGELGNLFYVITEGNVEITVRDAGGADLVLHKAGPGDFFGELSMLTNEPRSARVRAIEDLTTLVLERDDFFDFLRTHTHAAIDVMVELGGRLRENDRIFRSMVSRNVNEMEDLYHHPKHPSRGLDRPQHHCLDQGMGSVPVHFAQSNAVLPGRLRRTGYHDEPEPAVLQRPTRGRDRPSGEHKSGAGDQQPDAAYG